MTKTGRQSTKHHEMHTEEDALKKKTPTYDFFPVGESRLYWYIKVQLIHWFVSFLGRTEIKVRGIYPEDKVTIHFTIFAQVNACVYFFVPKCVNLHVEINLSLSNDKNAKRLKEI